MLLQGFLKGFLPFLFKVCLRGEWGWAVSKVVLKASLRAS